MALLISNGLIMTPEGSGVRVERGTLRIEHDHISEVFYGEKAHHVLVGPADRLINAGRHLVIPGLVDAHAHLYGTIIPGLIDQMPLDVRSTFLRAMFSAWGTRETHLTTLFGALRMLRHGTTTVLENVLQGLPATETAIRALLASGMRAVVGPSIADRPFHETMPGYLTCLPESSRAQALTAPSPDPHELVESCLAIVRRWHGAEDRITICLSPSAPHRCSDLLLTRIAEAAEAHALTIHTHLLETRVQPIAAHRLYGTTMVEHLHSLGLLRRGFSGAHAVWLADADLDRLAEAQVGVSHNPMSNLYLGNGIARIPELLRRGVAVGIGSDGPNCGSNTSLFEVMKLAAIVHRSHEVDAREWISVREAFRMATIGGAQVLGLAQDIGSLEVGKKADVVLLNADAPQYVPCNDPVSQMVYGETGSAVETVIVNGDIVFESGHPTRFDATSLLAEVRELGEHARRQAEAGMAALAPLEPFMWQAYFNLIQEGETPNAAAP